MCRPSHLCVCRVGTPPVRKNNINNIRYLRPQVISTVESAPQAFHPNIYPSGTLWFRWRAPRNKRYACAWKKTVRLGQDFFTRRVCAANLRRPPPSLHLMNIEDPAREDPYLQTQKNRPTFRRSVRTAALAASASRSVHPGWIHPSRRVPCTPTALRLAVLVAAPPGTPDHNKDFRHFILNDRVHRLHWPGGWWEVAGFHVAR